MRVATAILRFVIASVSEAIQSGLHGIWIASSLSLLAMTRAGEAVVLSQAATPPHPGLLPARGEKECDGE